MESGYIYVIQVCNTDGFVKIGFTKSNAEKRLSQLQVGSPYKLRLVASFYFEDVADIEKQLHTLYKEHQLEGEWFNIDHRDVVSHITETYFNGQTTLSNKQMTHEDPASILSYGNLRVVNGGRLPKIRFKRF